MTLMGSLTQKGYMSPACQIDHPSPKELMRSIRPIISQCMKPDSYLFIDALLWSGLLGSAVHQPAVAWWAYCCTCQQFFLQFFFLFSSSSNFVYLFSSSLLLASLILFPCSDLASFMLFLRIFIFLFNFYFSYYFSTCS